MSSKTASAMITASHIQMAKRIYTLESAHVQAPLIIALPPLLFPVRTTRNLKNRADECKRKVIPQAIVICSSICLHSVVEVVVVVVVVIAKS